MEINIFLSALQSAFATSVQQAVAAATAPLVERIDALEKNEEYLTRRITALENNPAIGVDTTLEKRVAVLEQSSSLDKMRLDDMAEKIAALEGAPSVLASQYTPISNEQFKAMLEEWGSDDELVRIKQRITALESEAQGENRYLNRDEVNELIAEAIDDHLGTYDHDEYDNHLGDDDKHFDGDIEDAVRDALNGTNVTLSF